MKKIHKIITFLLCVSVITVNLNFTCYAETSAQAISSYINLYNQVQSDLDENNPIQGNLLRQFVDNNYKYGMGFLIDYNENVLSDIVSAVRGYSSGGHDFQLPENATDQQVIDSTADYLKNNISVSGNSINYNNNSKNMLFYLANNYKSNLNNIKYSIDIKNSQQYLDATLYNALVSFCEEYQDDYIIILNGSRSLFNIWTFPKNKNSFWIYTYGLNQTVWGNLYTYDNNSFVDVLTQSEDIKRYAYSAGSYTETSTVETGSLGALLAPDEEWVLNNWTNYSYCISYDKSFAYLFYTTLNDATSKYNGRMPYYYNNTVYKDFSTSSGDYTVDNSNVNTVSYGDVTEYISDYHGTNNNYPDNSTLNNWIENKNEENITNNNGGDDSGGGGSGDNGGGSGDDNGDDSGGVGDIFGWLKQLGAALGSLIKGLGEFLAEVVEGLASALTTLLSTLSSLITDLTETLPTAFFDFLSTLFSWMPDEWLALFTSVVIIMCFIGIFKIIRG